MIFCVCFKQETAYEMRISDWSSDVCSSDLPDGRDRQPDDRQCDRTPVQEGERLALRRRPLLPAHLCDVHPDRLAIDAPQSAGGSLMALFARTPRAPLDYSRTLWMRLWVGAVMLFLYAPLIVLVIFSFNDSKRKIGRASGRERECQYV